MRISDWSSDVCSSDLIVRLVERDRRVERFEVRATDRLGIAEADLDIVADPDTRRRVGKPVVIDGVGGQPVIFAIFRIRSEEHTSELQSLMRISYAVFSLKKKTNK